MQDQSVKNENPSEILPSVSLHGQTGGGNVSISRGRRRPKRGSRAAQLLLAISGRALSSNQQDDKDAVDALDHADLLLAEILECMRPVAVRNRDSITGRWINSPYSRQASERRAAHDRRRASGRSR